MREPFRDFPFVNAVAEAHDLALLLTLVMRRSLPGLVSMTGIDAPRRASRRPTASCSPRLSHVVSFQRHYARTTPLSLKANEVRGCVSGDAPTMLHVCRHSHEPHPRRMRLVRPSRKWNSQSSSCLPLYQRCATGVSESVSPYAGNCKRLRTPIDFQVLPLQLANVTNA